MSSVVTSSLDNLIAQHSKCPQNSLQPFETSLMVFDTGFAQTPLYDVAPPAASRLKYV